MTPVRVRRCGGQAMTEFVVGTTLFLTPLFLIIPLLGKYADMKASVIQAARYVAWERTVWYGGDASSDAWPGNTRTDAEIKTNIPTLFFNDPTTNDPRWHDRVGVSMMSSSDLSSSYKDTPGTVNDALSFLIDITSTLGSFTLEMKGLYTGTATVTTAPITPISQGLGNPGAIETWNNLNLAITDSNVILVNSWNANGADHVKKMTQGLTPTSILDNAGVRAGLDVLGVFMPELFKFEPGKIEPDEVPDDRLAN